MSSGEVFGNRFGDFGRAYNDTQYLLRFGQELSGSDNTAFASDSIDYFIADDLTKAALNVVAPRCVGFDIDYVPVEQL